MANEKLNIYNVYHCVLNNFEPVFNGKGNIDKSRIDLDSINPEESIEFLDDESDYKKIILTNLLKPVFNDMVEYYYNGKLLDNDEDSKYKLNEKLLTTTQLRALISGSKFIIDKFKNESDFELLDKIGNEKKDETTELLKGINNKKKGGPLDKRIW